MNLDPYQSKDQIPMPPDDFPDPTDAQLKAIARARVAGADPHTVLATPTNGARATIEREETSSATSLALLALGGLTYGMDVLRRRAEDSRVSVDAQRRMGAPTGRVPIPEDERVKYALMGLAFKAPALLSGGLSVVEETIENTAGVVQSIVSPVTNSRLFNPFRNMYDGLAQRGEAVVNDLAQLGAQGQDFSKELIGDATLSAVNNVVDVVVESEEVRELVQQQTFSMLEEFLAFIQNRLRTVDLRLQRMVFWIIPGRQPSKAGETLVEIPLPDPSRVLLLQSKPRRPI